MKNGNEIKECLFANKFLYKGASSPAFLPQNTCAPFVSMMGSSQNLLQSLPHLAGAPEPPVFAGRLTGGSCWAKSSLSSLSWKGALCQRPGAGESKGGL